MRCSMMLPRSASTVALAAVLFTAACSDRGDKAAGGSGPSLKIEEGVPEAIKAQLATNPAFLRADQEGARTWKAVRAFYEKRQFAPAWIDGRRPTKSFDTLLEALRAAEREGLDPAAYGTPALIAHRQNAGGKRFSRDAFPVDDIDDVDVWSTCSRPSRGRSRRRRDPRRRT